MSILFLNILTLSADNLFHTFMILWEDEYFPTSNLLCCFTSVKLCPLVITVFYLLKTILESIFAWPFHVLNTSIWAPLSLRVSSVVIPNSFSRSSYLTSISPGISLVALLCSVGLLLRRIVHRSTIREMT